MIADGDELLDSRQLASNFFIASVWLVGICVVCKKICFFIQAVLFSGIKMDVNMRRTFVCNAICLMVVWADSIAEIPLPNIDRCPFIVN